MSDDDEWYSSGDEVEGLLHLLESKTPDEILQEEVQEQRVATTSAYRRVEELDRQIKAATAEFERQQKLLNSQLQAATAEFQRQEQLLHSKQKELATAQQAAPQQATPQQYIAALRKSRQGMTFKEWLEDASKNKQRRLLYTMYTQLIKDKLADPMKIPAFGKYPGEK